MGRFAVGILVGVGFFLGFGEVFAVWAGPFAARWGEPGLLAVVLAVSLALGWVGTDLAWNALVWVFEAVGDVVGVVLDALGWRPKLSEVSVTDVATGDPGMSGAPAPPVAVAGVGGASAAAGGGVDGAGVPAEAVGDA